VTLRLTLAQAGTDAPEWHADDADSADKRLFHAKTQRRQGWMLGDGARIFF